MGASLSSSTEKEKAEAYAIRLKAEAEARKADAEAAALARKTDAQVSKAAAQVNKMAAETARAKLNHRARVTRWALSAAGIALLAVDYYRNDHKPYIRTRIKRRLRENHAAAVAAAEQPKRALLPVPGLPFTLHAGTPTMVLAPTGAGKSTLLQEYAAKSARDSPTVLVRFRRPEDEKQKDETKPGSGPAVEIRMDEIASHVFDAIDYPTRQSIVGWVLRQPWTVPWAKAAGAPLPLPAVLPSSTRLIDAFQLLFKACADIYREDKVAKGDAARQCVLLFDEVQDLLKDKRLADAGGLEVFKQLARLLCSECVDTQTVLAAVAGSSAELNLQFSARTIMGANRWDYYRLPDPQPHVVVEALCKTGLEAPAAQRLVDALGTRMRVLNKALTTPGGVDVDVYIAAHMGTAISHVRSLFTGLSSADAHKVAGLLDALAAGATVPYGNLPPAVRPLVGEVVYINQDASLRFQSVPHERLWREGGLRAEVLRGIQEEKMQ